jgi:hypothetical protein
MRRILSWISVAFVPVAMVAACSSEEGGAADGGSDAVVDAGTEVVLDQEVTETEAFTGGSDADGGE